MKMRNERRSPGLAGNGCRLSRLRVGRHQNEGAVWCGTPRQRRECGSEAGSPPLLRQNKTPGRADASPGWPMRSDGSDLPMHGNVRMGMSPLCSRLSSETQQRLCPFDCGALRRPASCSPLPLCIIRHGSSGRLAARRKACLGFDTSLGHVAWADAEDDAAVAPRRATSVETGSNYLHFALGRAGDGCDPSGTHH